ncbi:MAG: homoserine kinase, partial [Rickettsia endosymbiont of Ixodes persulcatus]|nr:homoserine kinase [Rickettsia endosymbiont of Ixodes persulcatus]
LTLEKNMPLGSGLGSSGASCAAAAFAINALLPTPLAKHELLKYAVEGERLASGSAHADNVAPSLLGGICLVKSYHPLEIIQVPSNSNLYWVVAHPDYIIHTRDAREVLPVSLPINKITEQCGNLGALLIALMTNDKQLIKKSVQDNIAEPVRSKLIPAYEEVKAAALAAGALAFSISGSGPSVFAITDSEANAKQIGEQMKNKFQEVANLNSHIYISTINYAGTKLIEESE